MSSPRVESRHTASSTRSSSPRYEETIFALLRWLDVTPPPDLTLPDPRTVRLADDRTDEWVTRFRELQAADTPG